MTARILVADGQATNRITLKVRLAAACYHVTTAASAAQLLDELGKSPPPQMIVLGGGLPDADPVRLCEMLCGDPLSAGIPVVMLADQTQRLQGLRAGAAAVLDPGLGEQMLLARIRGLLRDNEVTPAGMAEPHCTFDHRPPGQVRITLIADSPGRALCWKHLLGQRLPYRFAICQPDQALGQAAQEGGADLYVIAADIEGGGDGLRLLSELRARNGSRNAAFVIATEPANAETAAMALDLGAGDVMSVSPGPGGIEAAALALQAQVTRKLRADRRRAEAQRNLVWAMTDPLTGLFNRRYALPRLAEIARQGQPFATILMDLDHFKQINDQYGHAAGDAVLCDIARRLQRVIGDAGLLARHGGEEFLAVLPATDESMACAMAERLRQMTEARPVLLSGLSGGGSVPVTMSVGLALTSPVVGQADGDTGWQHALERADRALLLAKARGRNRIMLAPPVTDWSAPAPPATILPVTGTNGQ